MCVLITTGYDQLVKNDREARIPISEAEPSIKLNYVLNEQSAKS